MLARKFRTKTGLAREVASRIPFRELGHFLRFVGWRFSPMDFAQRGNVNSFSTFTMRILAEYDED